MENDTLLEKVTEVDGCRVLGPCAIYARLGQGGMGAVYRARHMNLGIDVAVKCLKPSLADAQFVKRFKLEAKSAARIGHQNVVRVFDVAEDQGLHYIIMELVQGETARQRVERKGPLAIGEALEILFGAAQGLAEAHRKGIIHRDIKPDNILISSSGEVKLVDLGLAKPSFRDDSNSVLSSPNQVMGTLQYMPPEQWESTGDLTMAADVWALGATFYFLVTGREAINKGTPPQIMNRIVNQPFPDVRRARDDVPDEVIALLGRATAKAAQDRFEDAEALAAAISQLETRRSGLRDREAGTTQLRTLVSPPPQRTLDKIQTLLQVGPPYPGARLETRPAPLTRSALATSASALIPTEPRAAVASGRRAALVLLVVVLGAGASLFVPGVREWVFGPPPPPAPFADADRLEAQEDFANAIAAAEAYRKDESVPGRSERLGRLHANYSKQLVERGSYLEALAQIGKSIDLAGDAEGRQRSEDQRQQLLAKIGKGLEDALARGSASVEGEQFLFRGTLRSPLVKVKELRLDAAAVVLEAGGAFAARRSLGQARNVTVAVILDDAAATEIALRPWEPDLAFVEPIVAAQPIGGRAVTGSDTIQLRGKLTDPEAKLVLGDTEIAMVAQPDGSFTCSVQGLAEGENDLAFAARKPGQAPARCTLQVLRLRAPVVTMKEASPTESARCAVEVTADVWTKTVTVIIAGKQFSLQKADEAAFAGDVELAQGLNIGEIVATNEVGQQTKQRQVFQRVPAIESITLVLGATSIPVKPDALIYVNSRQAKVRVETGASGARLLVNDKRLDSEDLASGVDVVLEDLQEGKPVSVSFQVGFDELRSKRWKAQLVLDTVMPVLSDLKASPPPPQSAATEITVSGTWQDDGGCASLTVDNQAADVQPAGKPGSGTWSVKLKSPDKTRDLAIVAKDLAGNSGTTALPFEVAAPTPPADTSAPERPFEPAGFERKPDCRVENGYPEFLIHKATRIELVANEFGPGKKPSYYIATQETTEQQWGEGSSTNPKVSVTNNDVERWLKEPPRRSLDLPTEQEWDAMPSQWQQGQGCAEWLKSQGGTTAPLRKDRDQKTYARHKQLRTISFRVVYRVP